MAVPHPIREALTGLSRADSVRLFELARLRSGGTGMESLDLFQEACVRALSGQRQWPPDVPLIAFMAQLMRSIAHEARTRRRLEGGQGPEALNSGSHGPMSGTDLTPERHVSAAQELAGIEALFCDDPIGLAVLVGMLEGSPPAEIQQALSLSPTEYNSVLRRIRRRIQNHLDGTAQ